MTLPQRVRVLYVQPNSEVGGSDLCLLRLVAALDRTRYEALVVLPADGPLVSRFEAAGARVLFLPMMQLRTLPSPSYQLRYISRFWVTVARLAALIRRERVDLVHTNSLYALYGGPAALLARRRHVWHIREIPPQVPLARAALGRVVLALSTVVASMTKACSRGLFAGLDRRKVRILTEGLDLAVWSRRPGRLDIRADLGLPPGTPLVGFVARLDPWKGLDVFLDAMAAVGARAPDAVFLVAGGAPAGFESYREAMVARAAALGLGDRVRFLGWRYPVEAIPDLMAGLDVFCHTSVKPEPFGLVVIEALAMGCAVVASAEGGPLEIVEHGTSGVLVPPGRPEALAEAVSALLADPARRAALAAAARERIERRFSKAAFARDLHALYDLALGPGPR